MKLMACLYRMMVGLIALVLVVVPSLANAQGAPAISREQLDQLTAPIALYPDSLLSQVLMASTYPLEVVEANRWVRDLNNAKLTGDQLATTLQPMDWDPSVKSLVPFPQVLQMMDSRLDWTQKLGNAFLAQQADVMDSVQRLRAQARAAGNLQSNRQQVVRAEGPQIVIEPAAPQVVYVPYYNPAVVYGSWVYPSFPPFYFPPPVGVVVGAGLFFGVGIGIVAPLWGWGHCDWGGHSVQINNTQYNVINNYNISNRNRPAFSGNSWQHDAYHRRNVPYRDASTRQRYQTAAGGMTRTGSTTPRGDYRGYPSGRPGAAPGPGGVSGMAAAHHPPAQPTSRAASPAASSPKAPSAGGPPRPPTAFGPITRAPDAQAHALRGRSSRQSMQPNPAPRAQPPRQTHAPAGGQSEHGRRPGR